MRLRVHVSDRDRQSLDKLQDPATQTVSFEQPKDYRDRVVLKPWGYEFLAFENDYVAVWALHLGGGHSTSMHCHPRKHTSLLMLQGEAQCNFFNQREHLHAGQAVGIAKGVFHSTRAISSDGIYLIEVESPPAKTDLVRLKDEYGRQFSGYEGLSEMRTENLQTFSHFWLPAHSTDKRSPSYTFGGASIEIIRIDTPEDFKNHEWTKNSKYCVCEGELQNSQNQCVVAVGEIASGPEILSGANPVVFTKPLILMRFTAENWDEN
jgi:mannose-6-phosphate isomerase-like protein (cupin superfamily)